MRRPGAGQGSALLLCLVLLSVLSSAAIYALEVAWSGQRMVSAYVDHQQTWLQQERRLLALERSLWQLIDQQGFQPEAEWGWGEAQVRFLAGWMSEPEWVARCGPLFTLTLPLHAHWEEQSQSPVLQLTWQVCCETSAECLAGQFSRRFRIWAGLSELSS